MTFIDNIPWLSSVLSNIKEVIFGEKNSRIDAILDYFFSLREEKRAKVTLAFAATLLLIFLLTVFFYFYGLYNLQNKLNDAAYNIKELNNLTTSYISVNKQFSELASNFKENNNYNDIVSNLVQKTKELGLESSPISEKPQLVELPNTDPLFGQFQKVQIQYEINNVSLRKIIDYINAVQKMKHKFKVTELTIQQKYDTKLYFDLSLTLETYVPQ